MRLRKRMAATVLAVLVSLDQLAQTLLVAPFAIAGLAAVPDPDATISGVVGRAALAGRGWARPVAALIDALFLVLTLGTERAHTARTAKSEIACGLLAPIASTQTRRR